MVSKGITRNCSDGFKASLQLFDVIAKTQRVVYVMQATQIPRETGLITRKRVSDLDHPRLWQEGDPPVNLGLSSASSFAES